MLPLFFRPAAAGPLHGPFISRLLCAASFLLVVLCAALAFPVTASAHTATASTSAHVQPEKAKTRRCLYVRFYEANYVPNTGNKADFYFRIDNECGFPVHNIVATWKLTQLGCSLPGVPSKGTGDRQGSFSIPNLGVNGYEETTLSFTSYCISCTNGVMGFPPFSIEVEIKDVVGIIQERGTPLAILSPSHKLDTAVILNDAHNPGPLRCTN